MSRFFSRLFGSTPSGDKRALRKKRVLLDLEELENRLMPANDPLLVTTTADDPNGPTGEFTTLRDAMN